MPRRKKQQRRRFGWVRKLPSGRYQASYLDPTGQRRTAPDTFESEPEAGDWLTEQESLIIRRVWTDPDRGKVPFGPYARQWIDERPGLRPRTAQMYRWVLGRYLAPTFGTVHLVAIDPAMVRRWRRDLLDVGVSQSMVAKAYRLLRAILNTAVDHDELISRNPCRIKGAGDESPEERPTLSIGQVYHLADLMPPRLRLLILVATFASLRYGEVTALQRGDVDLQRGTVRIRQAFTEVTGKGWVLGPPKSRAAFRVVTLPASVVVELRAHLGEYAGPGREAFVFTGPKGAPIRRGNFNPLVDWTGCVKKIGAPGLHFHDLRHTGNMLAAAAGASTRDLMARMGHDSMRAALIYQHATAQADQTIARSIDVQVQADRKRRQRGP